MIIQLNSSHPPHGTLFFKRPSKSIAQRALACAVLAEGNSQIFGAGNSSDVLTAINICRSLGSKVHIEEDKLIVEPNKNELLYQQLNCRESGLCLRMFSPIAALSSSKTSIFCDRTLAARPHNFLQIMMSDCGVQFLSKDDQWPLEFKGPLHRKHIEVDASISSQHVTGLIFAFSSIESQTETRILLIDPVSIPYIDLSLDILKNFGIHAVRNGTEIIIPASGKMLANVIEVEPDWSSASCLLAAAAISGNVKLMGLKALSKQADAAILQALEVFGAGIEIDTIIPAVRVFKKECKPIEFDASDCPDLFPALVAMCSVANGKSTLHGANRLLHKESNRALTLQQEFLKFGVKILINDNTLEVYGNENLLNPGMIDTHQDHRIAMACSAAAFRSKGQIEIHHAEVVDKSYPEFFPDLQLLGANIRSLGGL
ncbi:MAG: 3-phosphoshikimate 1-carboxyvinyltransferase [Saprospiraceae bacterium]|jgi:3-phosphoshikimate 1-carboxyvinyltransferase|nr:3-phosphoshikimate 1-carboxyvinyltransferase [Saprospiraceae bacterium]